MMSFFEVSLKGCSEVLKPTSALTLMKSSGHFLSVSGQVLCIQSPKFSGNGSNIKERERDNVEMMLLNCSLTKSVVI